MTLNHYHRKILSYIYLENQITKMQLSKYLNVTIPTVTLYINELVELGIIKEIGIVDSKLGRKPTLFEISSFNKYTIGIDIRQDYIILVILNLKMNIIYKTKEKYNVKILNEEIKRIIYKSIVMSDLKKDQIEGIGIAFPGIVDMNNLILEESPIIDIRDYSVKELEIDLGIPIYIGNEANYAAYAENIIGSSEKYKNSIYLSINEGVGGGIIINNSLYLGSLTHAGEIGHMTIEYKGLKCKCGRNGCWEQYVSSNRIEEILLKNNIKNLEDLLKKYNSGEKSEIFIELEKYFDYLIAGIINLFLIFDLDCIIIGGVWAPYEKEIKNILVNKIKNIKCKVGRNLEKIIFPKLLFKVSAIGAGIVPFSYIYDFDIILDQKYYCNY
ncbi:ROK family protein [Oceanivirga salmonicida]|uniref:ROK family protein n=1 Tax=Oceanivirga salmonicida TaxID=1769291 RepID=UPI0012E1462C|nr:ROK family transcriptional regulator [Oceanivirga salmonicida]